MQSSLFGWSSALHWNKFITFRKQYFFPQSYIHKHTHIFHRSRICQMTVVFFYSGSFYDPFNIVDYVMSNGSIIHEWWITKYSDGSSHGPFEALSSHFFGRTEENHKKS